MSGDATSPVTIVADQVFATPGGHPLYADLYLPDATSGPRPTIVWLHGGAWRVGDRRLGPDLSRHFAARGFAMVGVDYRLSHQALFPAQIEDVKTAIRWVRDVAARYSLDPDRIGVWGSSAGAHLGALAAISRAGEFEGPDSPYSARASAVRAAVLGYPPVDFLRMDPDPASPESQLIGAPVRTRPDLAARANPISYMHGRVPPCLLLHGSRDETVAPLQSELLYESLVAHGNAATLCSIEGLAHGFLNETALDERGPCEMTVRSAAATRHAAPVVQRAHLFRLIEDFFRATL